MAADTLPPSVAFEVAFRALDNAQQLHRAAECLDAAGHYGPAVSLSISAREEVGKFFSALFVALEQRSGKGAIERLRSHRAKQGIGAGLALLPSIAEHLRSALVLTQPIQAATFESFSAALLERITAGLETFEWPADQSKIESGVRAAADGADEMKRRRGMYVDPVRNASAWEVSYPGSFSAADAQEEIRITAQSLSVFNAILLVPGFGSGLEPLEGVDPEAIREQLTNYAADHLGGETLSPGDG
jgi:AbiV family abortive infection protein